jgi:hydrogenase/urease accessory protein HupE
MNVARFIAVLLLICALAGAARADELRPGYLALTQKNSMQWNMVWKAPINSGLASSATPALPSNCSLSQPQRALSNGAAVSVWTVTCSKSLMGEKVGLSSLDASFSDALMRIAPLGRPVQVARLTSAEPMAEVFAKPESGQVAKTYFVLGVEHIITGYDHLLFVLSLVLLITGGWQVAKTVTAFTVAHSITLIATALGVISIARQPVEICIALSIIFLAVEIVKAKPDKPRLAQRIPWTVAFAFGLLHGFGFAGALGEIGLPEGEVPVALLTFNVGVEAGQLIIVALGLAALATLRRFAFQYCPKAKIASAYAIGSVAAFWMIQRAVA